MTNQEAVDIARKIRDPQKAAKQLATEAVNRESKDDISCIVVRFRVWKWKGKDSSPPSLVCLCVMYTSDVFFTGMDGWIHAGFNRIYTSCFQKASKSNQSKKKLLNLVQHQVINILFFFFPSLFLFLSDHCNISVLLKSGCAGLLYLDSSLCRFLQQQFFCNFS